MNKRRRKRFRLGRVENNYTGVEKLLKNVVHSILYLYFSGTTPLQRTGKKHLVRKKNAVHDYTMGESLNVEKP